MADLTGKTALVTGASRGIGRGITQRLATDGALVAVHYGSNEVAATETVEKIQANGGRAFAVRAELGVDGDVDTLFAGLEEGLLLSRALERRDGSLCHDATPRPPV